MSEFRFEFHEDGTVTVWSLTDGAAESLGRWADKDMKAGDGLNFSFLFIEQVSGE